VTGMAARGTLAAEVIGRPAVNAAVFAFFVLLLVAGAGALVSQGRSGSRKGNWS